MLMHVSASLLFMGPAVPAAICWNISNLEVPRDYLYNGGIISLKKETGIMMKRHEAREKALQTLFQLDGTELTIEEAMEHVMDGETDQFYKLLVEGTNSKQQEIDEKLKGHLQNWSLERLPKVERTILRMAVFELEYMDDAPSRVVLNEAIELSKTFGDDKSSRFVNGVLSKFTDQTAN